MIMKIFSLENDITFTEEYINVLQIQDKKLFTNVINSLNDNINNIEDTKERIIILDNDIEIKIEKEVLMIIDVFNIDFNQKKIQSALYNKIEKLYKQEFERMSEFQTIFQKLQLNVLDVFKALCGNVLASKMYSMNFRLNSIIRKVSGYKSI